MEAIMALENDLPALERTQAYRREATRMLRLFLILSIIVLVWVAAIRLTLGVTVPSGGIGDLASILFGASSLALFLLSFLVAFMSLIGWSAIKEEIRRRVKQEVSRSSESISLEAYGQLHSGLGLIFGRLCRAPGKIEKEREDFLDFAIFHVRRSVGLFAEIHGRPYWAAKNNLAFYLALKGDWHDKEVALQLAQELRAEHFRVRRIDFLLTYCRVVTEFEDDEAQLRWVNHALLSLGDDPGAGPDQKEEARLCLALLVSKHPWVCEDL
jgi:hypothetical protein